LLPPPATVPEVFRAPLHLFGPLVNHAEGGPPAITAGLSMVRIAHLTDPHLPLAGVRLAELAGKRILGYLSWRLKRHRRHRAACLEKVLADIRAAATDHIVLTGDVVNISSRAEFAAAEKWLARLGPPGEVSLVPGNHDRYVAEADAAGLGRLRPWMSGSDSQQPPGTFPYVRYVRNVAVIGLDSAWPAPWTEASGRVGEEQLTRLAHLLRDCRGKGLFRLLLVHHPPLPDLATKPRKALKDAEALAGVLRRHGAEVVLFGHNHTWIHETLESDQGPVHLLAAPSASMRPDAADRPAAGWALLAIDRRRGRWIAEVERRGLARDGRLRTLERFTLAF
jgi:3',5'-cyclic AMP phosphodiesterase CpdA